MIDPKQINEISLENSKQDAIKDLFIDMGEGGKKKPKPTSAPVTPPVKKAFDMGAEIKQYGSTATLPYSEDRLASDVVKSAATKMGVSPSMLFASAWQEGMNKAAFKPDDVSPQYAKYEKGFADFPVDGYGNYGLDTFGSRLNELKKYLPEGFESRFKTFEGVNEKGQKIQSAAFKTDEDALIAKAAIIKSEMQSIDDYAAKKGLKLDDATKNYFTLSAYNSGTGSAKKIMDEYALAEDKEKFILEGLTTKKGVHKNVKPRLDNMALVEELFKTKSE